MKHQYFGDINDYRKYGILRTLSECRLTITVCWMLTENDGRSDGRNISYLDEEEKFLRCDPKLFNALHDAVIKKNCRNVREIQTRRLIPKARYMNDLVPDSIVGRKSYFAKLLRVARGSDLIFFDPDNGIEVKSKPKGKKDSNKYVYWDEVENFWRNGYSLLMYQHFPRVNRNKYIKVIKRGIMSRTGSKDIVAFKTSSVAFFLLIQGKHRRLIHRAVESLRERWNACEQKCKVI